MTSTVSEAMSALSEHSRQARKRLTERCAECLRSLLPQPDSHTRGIWNEDAIRTLTAIFELQRVEAHSELEERRIDNHLITGVIAGLATTTYFTDPRATKLLREMEAHLRLLAAALRLFKYTGKSLDEQLHQEVYDGTSRMFDVFDDSRSRREESLQIDDWNVAFLLKHCQYLLVSIDRSDSLSRKVARRAVIGFDAAMSAVGENYQDLRPALLQILKRQRDRPKWHDEYMQLEDACWCVFASDIRLRAAHDHDIDIATLVEETATTTYLLRDSMEARLDTNRRKSGRFQEYLRHAVGKATQLVSDSGPYEEHGEYLQYGILDLLTQLSIRIRKRSRRKCFEDFLRVVRMVLERSPKSAKPLHLKATDLWNRILDLGHKDGIVYGDEGDRDFIDSWINQNAPEAENPQFSKEYTFNVYPADKLGGLNGFSPNIGSYLKSRTHL